MTGLTGEPARKKFITLYALSRIASYLEKFLCGFNQSTLNVQSFKMMLLFVCADHKLKFLVYLFKLGVFVI